MTPMIPDVPAICADDVARLRERLAEASPQPWVYRPDKYDDWGWIRGVERDDRDIGPFRPIVANAKDSMVDDAAMADHRRAGTDPYGSNALLIVEAVNALPALLDTIERQRELLEPFAIAADDLDDKHGDHSDIWEASAGMSITAGDLRAVRAHLLKEQQP